MSKALAGQGFKSAVVAYGATVGIDVEVVARNPADRGFVPQPKALGGGANAGHPVLPPAPGPGL